MVANKEPIFPLTPDIQWNTVVTAANTTKDGTSGTLNLIYTAGADGTSLSHIVAQPFGTNVQSLARVFINNGGSLATAANNTYYGQIGLPATTLVENAEMPSVIGNLGISLQAGYRVYVTLGTAVAAGWQFTCVGADY